jgi:hypothetical protein
MARKNQYVVNHNGKWAVRGEGNSKITKAFDKQIDAINYGRKIAKNNQSELIIQGKNGQIREKNSYGKDKFPPKG